MHAHPAGGERGPVVPVQQYEIRVRGKMGEALRAAFAPLEADAGRLETVLHGPVASQTELQGMLERVAALGLELVEVRRLDDD
jgi:hypothetical protein